MSHLLCWLCLLTTTWARGDSEPEGEEILDAMLGAPPPQPAMPTAPPVIATTVAPIISPNQPGCAADITTGLYDIANVARMITYSTADCAQPGQIATVCANDILTSVRYMAKTASIVSDSVFTCGNINAGCSQTIANAIAELTHLVDYIALMEITCDKEKLACSLQVFSFISSGLHAAKNIDTAIMQCPLPDGDGGDDGGDDGDDGDSGDDGGSSVATSTAEPPPDLTPQQIAEFYPNGVNGAHPVLASNRLLLGSSLRGQGGRLSKPSVAESPSILPTSAEGLE